MASYWKYSCTVEVDGRRDAQWGEVQGPDHATEENIRIGAEEGLKRLFPRGFKMTNFMATRLG